MSACEKCWADAGGNPYEYKKLLARRNICDPEEQAGPGAGRCPSCERATLHQHTGQPMCGCKPIARTVSGDGPVELHRLTGIASGYEEHLATQWEIQSMARELLALRQALALAGEALHGGAQALSSMAHDMEKRHIDKTDVLRNYAATLRSLAALNRGDV